MRRLWCSLVGHRWGPWVYPKVKLATSKHYTAKPRRERVCARCHKQHKQNRWYWKGSTGGFRFRGARKTMLRGGSWRDVE